MIFLIYHNKSMYLRIICYIDQHRKDRDACPKHEGDNWGTMQTKPPLGLQTKPAQRGRP